MKMVVTMLYIISLVYNHLLGEHLQSLKSDSPTSKPLGTTIFCYDKFDIYRLGISVNLCSICLLILAYFTWHIVSSNPYCWSHRQTAGIQSLRCIIHRVTSLRRWWISIPKICLPSHC